MAANLFHCTWGTAILSTDNSPFSHLRKLAPAVLHERRERIFLILAGLFLGSMTMLNILGLARFIDLYTMTINQGQPDAWDLSFSVAIGVLPYPLTFLCTDLISELYGRRRANWTVFVGLLLNLWVLFILWLGGILPGSESPEFFHIRTLTFAAIGASMVAYLAAQFCDVYVFHALKKWTNGKHLWLRNNGSTLASQLIDTVAVILITFWAGGLDDYLNEQHSIAFQLAVRFIFAGYVFKLIVALLDTIPIYIAVHYLSRYLRIDPTKEHAADSEEAGK
jgi:queuosine precursor transporter